MEDKLVEKKLSSKKIFHGKILNLYFDKVKLPNGNIATREKVTHPGAVGIVPVNNQKEVYLVRQYRYPPDDTIIEIPAGKIDNNEDPDKCALRELREEVGAGSADIVKLSAFYTTPGFSNELLHLYLATNFDLKDNNLDDDEFLQIVKFSLKDAIHMINTGIIKDAKTIIGLLLARDYLNG
jgi:ADP-ribose pyrophosphatase